MDGTSALWASAFAAALGAALLAAILFVAEFRNRVGPDRIWSLILLFSAATACWEAWVLESGVYTVAPHLLGLFNGAFFLIGPCLWLYSSTVLRAPVSPLSILAHLSLFILFSIWLTAVFLLHSAEVKRAIADAALTVPYHLSVIGWAKLLHVSGYALMVWLRTRRARRRDEAVRSNLMARDLRWLSTFSALVMVLAAVLIASDAMAAAGWISVRTLNNLAALGLSGLLFAVAVKSLHQPRFETPPPDLAAPTYAKSGVSEDRLAHHVARLERVMQEDALYLDPDLMLDGLAQCAKLSPQQTSQALNQGLKLSFYQFVNQHRLEHAKARLMDPGVSILEAALDSGFANKATFNKHFKASTGLTPSQWKAQELKTER